MSACERRDLTWKGCKLFKHGQRTPVALIEPDKRWPGMWRFRLLPDGELSDMVNLSRAKDAAASLAVAAFNNRTAMALAPERRTASPMRETHSPALGQPGAEKPLYRASFARAATRLLGVEPAIDLDDGSGGAA
jgi:hypothetical protein